MKWNILAAAGLGSILLALQPLTAKAVTLEPVEQITVKASLPTQSLPVQYDMRKAGLTTRVQRQGSYGMCWSFASLASLESTIIRQEPAIDLSEWSLAYYAYAPDYGFPVADNTDPLRMGGNFYVAAPMLTGWRGPVNEADAPFGDSSVLDPALTVICWNALSGTSQRRICSCMTLMPRSPMPSAWRSSRWFTTDRRSQ